MYEVWLTVVVLTRSSQDGVVCEVGRRKTAVAEVRIEPGTGAFTVNGDSLHDYFAKVQSL